MTKQVVMGIDFKNLIFSSFFSDELTNRHGVSVNAIRGFFFKLARYQGMFKPLYTVIANDLGRSTTFRRKLFPNYKLTRISPPDALIEQFRYGLELLSYIGYPILNHTEYEADDMLGMVTKLATDNNLQMVIISSDKDYYQLINDDVNIYNHRSRETIDRKRILNQYKLEPHQLLDVKALAGDRSDNIPGARGIGEATALRLIQRYGDVETIMANVNTLSSKLRFIIKRDKHKIHLSKILGRIVTDYSIMNLSLDSLKWQDSRNPSAAHELVEYLELPSLLNIINYSLSQGEAKTAV